MTIVQVNVGAIEQSQFIPVDFDAFKRFETMLRDDAHALALDLIELRDRLHLKRLS